MTGEQLLPWRLVCTDLLSLSRYCDAAELIAAKNVKVGDKIYVAKESASHVVVCSTCTLTHVLHPDFGHQSVQAVSRGISLVRYVLTDNDSIVVNGVVASVYSTAAKTLETLPFRLVDKMVKGVLQWGPVATSLRIILESPALRNFEFALNAVANLPSMAATKSNPFVHVSHLSH